jgi:hypothetical protein
VAVTVKLDSGGFVKGNWGQMVAAGTLEGATIYADSQTTQPLYHLSGTQLDAMRAAKAAEKAALARAEEDRRAEQQRQRLLAQREQYIRALTAAAPSVKLANSISDGQIDYYRRLDNVREARAVALVRGEPVPVAMLVQADGNGRDKVDTKWPGKLQVTVPNGQPSLKSSGWYLVQGTLTVPEGDSVPPAQLAAKKVQACEQPKCADAMDAAAIVDRKLATMSGMN